jgi:hypothetical protein
MSSSQSALSVSLLAPQPKKRLHRERGVAARFARGLHTAAGTLLVYLVCSECAASFSLLGGRTIPSDSFDAQRLPWAAPACERCLVAWRATPNRIEGAPS